MPSGPINVFLQKGKRKKLSQWSNLTVISPDSAVIRQLGSSGPVKPSPSCIGISPEKKEKLHFNQTLLMVKDKPNLKSQTDVANTESSTTFTVESESCHHVNRRVRADRKTSNQYVGYFLAQPIFRKRICRKIESLLKFPLIQIS